MPKQDDRACEMQKPSEIGGPPLIAGHEAPRVLEPREKPFDFPAAPITAQRAPILGEVNPIGTMGGDQFDPTCREGLVEPIAVIRSVADEPLGIVGQKAGVQGLLDEPRFMRRRRGDGNGERKTSAVCNGHDLGALAALGFPDMEPFFLALANEPSMKVSLRSNPPRACRSAASALTTRRSVPRLTQR
jgi:hypothetical protein